MLTHVAAALGVLGLLTVVPGPDMAVVTRRALAVGPADGGRDRDRAADLGRADRGRSRGRACRAATCSCCPRPGTSSNNRRALGRTTGVVLIGFGLAVATD
jgi:threonine/homoserine/homoserine lactone efflux protein